MADVVATLLKTNHQEEAIDNFLSPEQVKYRRGIEKIIDTYGLCSCRDIAIAGPCGQCFNEAENHPSIKGGDKSND